MKLASIVILCLALAGPAHAALVQTGSGSVPSDYRQGLASDASAVYFAGAFEGLTSTKPSGFGRIKRVDKAIPADVVQSERYNHIGDIAITPGGRLLLPLECYAPFEEDQNPCDTGSIGVVDAKTLGWLFYVKLDPAEIPKAMWAATDPEADLLWTSVGADLIAFRLSEINEANAAPAGPALHSVRRIPAALPDGASGGVVYAGRLYVASQHERTLRIVAFDRATGAAVTEYEATTTADGETEGLDAGPYGSGILHYEIAHGTFSLVEVRSFLERGTALTIRAPGRTRAAARKIRVRVTSRAGGVGLEGVKVTLGRVSARTNADGFAVLKVKLGRGLHRIRATRSGLTPAARSIRAT